MVDQDSASRSLLPSPTPNAATSPDGRPGCCADSGFDVAPDCAATSDDVKVYLSVRTLANECVTYTVNYHY